MHPILARGGRLALYLALWVLVGACSGRCWSRCSALVGARGTGWHCLDRRLPLACLRVRLPVGVVRVAQHAARATGAVRIVAHRARRGGDLERRAGCCWRAAVGRRAGRARAGCPPPFAGRGARPADLRLRRAALPPVAGDQLPAGRRSRRRARRSGARCRSRCCRAKRSCDRCGRRSIRTSCSTACTRSAR